MAPAAHRPPPRLRSPSTAWPKTGGLRRLESTGRRLVGLGLGLLLGGLSSGLPGAALGADEAASNDPRRAVAAPNLRIGVAYDYGHVDATDTTFVGPSSTQTLALDDVDGHAVQGQLVGTVPLLPYTGLRTTVRGGFHQARRSLDALDPGRSTIDGYGALAELFLRSASFGSFAAGVGFDRLDGGSGLTANQLTGSADAQIFFPDLGLGALDWFTRFEFRHRQIAGDGQPFDVDADVYHVDAGARWYAAPDVALVFSGTWQRVEEEFLSEDDRTGSLGVHWRLPLPLRPISLELFAVGTAGLSEYKQSPFRGDQRLVYGGRAGLTLRLFSGTSLVDSMRRYD